MDYYIEDWWQHCGCYDREQASEIPYDGNTADYLTETDKWWESLTFAEKKAVYEEFFEEV